MRQTWIDFVAFWSILLLASNLAYSLEDPSSSQLDDITDNLVSNPNNVEDIERMDSSEGFQAQQEIQTPQISPSMNDTHSRSSTRLRSDTEDIWAASGYTECLRGYRKNSTLLDACFPGKSGLPVFDGDNELYCILKDGNCYQIYGLKNYAKSYQMRGTNGPIECMIVKGGCYIVDGLKLYYLDAAYKTCRQIDNKCKLMDEKKFEKEHHNNISSDLVSVPLMNRYDIVSPLIQALQTVRPQQPTEDKPVAFIYSIALLYNDTDQSTENVTHRSGSGVEPASPDPIKLQRASTEIHYDTKSKYPSGSEPTSSLREKRDVDIEDTLGRLGRSFNNAGFATPWPQYGPHPNPQLYNNYPSVRNTYNHPISYDYSAYHQKKSSDKDFKQNLNLFNNHDSNYETSKGFNSIQQQHPSQKIYNYIYNSNFGRSKKNIPSYSGRQKNLGTKPHNDFESIKNSGNSLLRVPTQSTRNGDVVESGNSDGDKEFFTKLLPIPIRTSSDELPSLASTEPSFEAVLEKPSIVAPTDPVDVDRKENVVKSKDTREGAAEKKLSNPEYFYNPDTPFVFLGSYPGTAGLNDTIIIHKKAYRNHEGKIPTVQKISSKAIHINKNMTSHNVDEEMIVNFLSSFPTPGWCIPEKGDEYNYRCCEKHENCFEKIDPEEEKYGLKNSGLYARLHCLCEQSFLECLKEKENINSNSLGVAYFNILAPKCFAKEQKTRCLLRNKWKKCVKYGYVETSEAKYQWIDTQTY